MKFILFCIGVWLSLVVTVNSRDARQTSALELRMPEEREIITREKLEEYLASKEDNTGDILELAKSTFGGIVAISQIDYTQSGGKIAWELANAVVPIIGAALALVPGVGVIISGVFLGIWSVISPLFAPKQDNPMEKMINELAEKLNKKIDDKLRNLVNLAIYGEIARNNYICNKYSYISQYFSEDFKNDVTLRENDAIKLMLYLNDCDNFLKDTAEAFVYNEYADVLWVPGAITTSTRVGFLAELIKNGHLLGMDKNITVMYFRELKKDTQRQFEFYSKGLEKVWRDTRKNNYDKKKDYLKDVSAVEKGACTLQGQFYYFDRELYSYGMPTILNNTDLFATINMADHYKPSESKGSKIKHLQIFLNVTDKKFPANLPPPPKDQPHRILEFMNCFLGPMHLRAPSTYWFNFKAMPAKNQYSYEFRVAYFQRTFGNGNEHEESIPLLREFDKNSAEFKAYEAVQKKINPKVNLSGKTCLNIEFIFPFDHPKANETKKLIHIPANARYKTCPYSNDRDFPYCNTFIGVFHGGFRMYSAGTFNHGNEDLNSLIAINEPSRRFIHYSGQRYNPVPTGFIVAVEVILRPRIA